jgi:trimethylamine--corrinoid protein Co-methyltransferase
LGCAHTQSNFKEAFWRTEVFDYKPFETWDEEGAKDTMSLASLRVEKMLANYQQPPLSADIEEALAAYITKKKSSMPDSFI